MLLLAAVATVAVWRARDAQERNQSLEHTSAVVATLGHAQSRHFQGLSFLAALALSEDQMFADLYRETARETEQDLIEAHAQALVEGKAERAADLADLIERQAQFDEDIEAGLAAVFEGAPEEAAQSAIEAMPALVPRAEAVSGGLDRVVAAEQAELAAERAAADRAADLTLWLLVGLSTIAFIVGAVALVMLVVSVVRPLASLRRSVRAIAAGDLEIRTAVSGPAEVASLARDFNEMVSERRQAEEALRASEQQYQELIENANDIMFTIDLDGQFTSLNKVGEEVTGYTRTGAPTVNFAEIVAPEHLGRAREMIEHKLARGGATRYEIEIIARDGRRVPLEISTRLVCEGGKPIGIQGIARDITERRRAEEALRESEERYRGLFESASDLIQSVAPDGSLIYVNRAWREALGYGEEEIPGLSLSDFIHPDSKEYCEETFKRVLAGEQVVGVEAKFVGKDGRVIIVEGSASCSFKDGEPLATRGIFRDITERKRAETELRLKDEAIASSIDGIAMADPEGNVSYVNNAFLRLWGCGHAHEVLGRPVVDFWQQPDKAAEAIEALRSVGGWKGELLGRRRDGSSFEVQISATLVKDEAGSPVCMMASFVDITERKRMEQALREQARRDPLTGALNHGAIVGELRALLSDSGDGSTHALAMVDVDGLKAINDTYGHQVGDAVLVTVAGALSNDGASVGRYGGDEFVVILPDADRDAAQRYRDAVLDSLAHAGLADPETGANVPVVVSVGLVVYPTEAARIEELIKLADSEMYAVKRQRPVGSTARTLPQALGSERAARTVGELVPLLTSPGDLDEKLRLAAHRLSVGAGCDVVHFSMFPHEAAGETVSESFGQLPAELVEAWDENVRSKWELPHPLRLLVERTRRPVILEDVENDDRIPARQRELLRTAGLRSGLVVPLLLQDTPVGLLAVGSRQKAAFGPNEAQFFMAVATQVAGIARMATLVEELRSASDRLTEARIETVLLLAAAAEAHDHTTGLHLQRVRAITEALASELGYSEEEARDLGVAAVLHDIGKVRVPDAVLSNVNGLTGQEWEMLKRHTIWGEEFLKGRPGFELATTIARCHHERWDGSGYPDGLAGEAIPEAATIVAVADAFDAMTSGRPYKTARSVASAAREIAKCSGSQFSPKVVRALQRLRKRGTLPPTPSGSLEYKPAA